MSTSQHRDVASSGAFGPLTHTIVFLVGFYAFLKLTLPTIGGWLAAPDWFSIRTDLQSSGRELALYMTLGALAWYCYLSYEDERWAEFRRPIFEFVGKQGPIQRAVMALVPPLVGGLVFYHTVLGAAELEMSPIRHPTPPEQFAALRNPFRHPTREMLNAFDEAIRSGAIDASRSAEPAVRAYARALAAGTARPEQRARAFFRRVTEEGRVLFMINCRPCHGTRAMGDGPMSVGQRRQPADFTGVETIATLVEGAVFWRVKKGGIGLPHVGAPWESAMPRWETDLTDEQIWKIITAEYDIAGNAPRQPEGRQGATGP
ncbi:MAG: c-type cytochrome [Candidatus Binatia bacterium]